MPIVFSCPRCDQKYSVPEAMAGRRMSCKKCGQERTIPAAAPAMKERSYDSFDEGDVLPDPPEDDFGGPPPPPSRGAKTAGGSSAVPLKAALAGMGLLLLVAVIFLLGTIIGRRGEPAPGAGGIGAKAPDGGGQADPPLEDTGEQGTVRVIASGLDDEAKSGLFMKKLGEMVDPGASFRGVSGIGSGGTTTYDLHPVSDPDAFAAALTFAKVKARNGRTFAVAAELPADELDAFRKEKDEEKSDREEKVAANDPDNPFRKAGESPPPLDVDPGTGPIEKALAATRDRDGFKAREAIKELASAPDNRKAEVVKALEPLLESKDFFTVREALKTLGALKSLDAAPAIVAMLDDDRHRKEAMDALVAMGDPRAAGPIADRIKTGWPHAERALIAMGAAAEPAVIAKLEDSDPEVRKAACEVLAEIGTEETVKAMRKLPADRDDSVRNAANNAMRKIIARTGGR